jgi:hypothetical protein
MFYFETGALAAKLVSAKGDSESLSGKPRSFRVLSKIRSVTRDPVDIGVGLLAKRLRASMLMFQVFFGGSVLCDPSCVGGRTHVYVGLSLELIVVV